MSRSGYSDDIDDNWALIRWRGQVASAIRGQRGQRLLRELAEALDAMPVKELIADELEEAGAYCTLGVVGKVRGIDMSKLDPESAEAVGLAFDIAAPLAKEIVYENDDGYWGCSNETPAARWRRMRNWVDRHLIKEQSNGEATCAIQNSH